MNEVREIWNAPYVSEELVHQHLKEEAERAFTRLLIYY